MSFEKEEIKELIIAIVIAAFVFSFNEWGIEEFSLTIGITNFIRALIITAIIFPVHAFIQKQVAQKFDCTSKFKLLSLETVKYKSLIVKKIREILKPIGPIITLLISFISNGKLLLVLLSTAEIKPNKIKRVGREFTNIKEKEFAQIALSGPLTEIILLVIFKLLLPIAPIFFQKAMFISASLAVFHILPIPKMDGGLIFFGSRILYTFSLVFIIIFIITIYQLSVFNTLIISIILAGIASLIYFYKFFKSRG